MSASTTAPAPTMKPDAVLAPAPLADMHCHLGFCSHAPRVAEAARQADTLLFANSTTSAEYAKMANELDEFSNVTVGFGMHPWWVAPDTDPHALVDCLDQHAPYALGEIGLDFGKRHADTRDAQVAAFKAILQWAAKTGGHLISLHAVHSAGIALDLLEETGALNNNACIFHWFSGSQPELMRAIGGGCYFSVGSRMMHTKKGRAYLEMLPVERLLLETDQPEPDDEGFTFAQLLQALDTAADELCAIKEADCLGAINATSRSLLGL